MSHFYIRVHYTIAFMRCDWLSYSSSGFECLRIYLSIFCTNTMGCKLQIDTIASSEIPSLAAISTLNCLIRHIILRAILGTFLDRYTIDDNKYDDKVVAVRLCDTVMNMKIRLMATGHIRSYVWSIVVDCVEAAKEIMDWMVPPLYVVVSACLCIFPDGTMIICVRAISSSSWQLPPLQYFLRLNKIIAKHNHCNFASPSSPSYVILCIICRTEVMVIDGDGSFFTSFPCPMHKFLKILAKFEVCTSIQT